MAIRAFDLAVSTLLLALLGPLMLLIVLLVRLDSPGPALFRQVRIGRGNRPFTMLKFRTMRRDAPVREAALRVPDFERFVYAPADAADDRVTRLGRLLRRTSLDELPQLINVLRGEMSLVGPRPDIPELVAQYPPAYLRRHQVRPGITGLAQVSGRAELPYGEMIHYDLDYVRNHSLRRNIAILVKTLLVVLTGRGAR